MTYRAWEQKPLDRTAVRELTAAIAEQAAAQLEEQAMDEAPWSDEKYKAVLAAQQKENALLAGILADADAQPAQSLTVITTAMTVRAAWQMSHRILSILSIWTLLSDGLLV